jgi:GTPase Era involved in 16S rRNA processing
MFDAYSKNKADIVGNLIRLEKIAATERIRNACRLLREKLEADIFSLVVVGQFKRGKTTFINALIGEDLLPTAIIPLTSIITILGHGDKLSITTFFKNGTKKECAPNELPLYVAEKHNPKNKKGVDRVEIKHPSPYLKNGVQIIDTPGIASTHEHNTKTTYDYLPHSDAAIFLLSVDPPITQAELHFLRDLKNLVGRTFFIQNKIDTVSVDDCEESLSFSKEIIEKEAGYHDVIVYPISAKEALKEKNENFSQRMERSGLARFEQSLELFLIKEKGEVWLKSVVEKTCNFINEETFLAELEEKALRVPLAELENKIAIFKEFIREIEREKIDGGILLTEEVKTLQIETLVADLEDLKQEKTPWLAAKITEFASEHKSDGNKKFVEQLDGFIGVQIKDVFDHWRIEEERILKQRLEEILGRFMSRMNKSFEKIVDFSATLFGIVRFQFRIQESLPQEIEFRFQTTDESNMLSMTIGLAKRSLPKAVAHKLILKDAQEKAAMTVERHCGKARYDFSQRMDQYVRNYHISVTEAVSATQAIVLKAVEAGVAHKHSIDIETTSLETSLNNRIKNLVEIKESMRDVVLKYDQSGI